MFGAYGRQAYGSKPEWVLGEGNGECIRRTGKEGNSPSSPYSHCQRLLGRPPPIPAPPHPDRGRAPSSLPLTSHPVLPAPSGSASTRPSPSPLRRASLRPPPSPPDHALSSLLSLSSLTSALPSMFVCVSAASLGWFLSVVHSAPRPSDMKNGCRVFVFVALSEKVFSSMDGGWCVVTSSLDPSSTSRGFHRHRYLVSRASGVAKAAAGMRHYEIEDEGGRGRSSPSYHLHRWHDVRYPRSPATRHFEVTPSWPSYPFHFSGLFGTTVKTGSLDVEGEGGRPRPVRGDGCVCA